jgi:hypothetical protein
MTHTAPKITAQVTHFPKAASTDAPPPKHPPKETPKKSKLTPLQILLALENEALAAPDRLALKHQAVNHPRRLLDVGHIFWVERRGKTIKIAAMSSQSEINKGSPFIQDICHILKRRAKSGALNSAQALSFTETSGGKAENDSAAFDYVFPNGFFAPFAPHSHTGGLLFTRAAPFEPAQTTIMTRLAQSYGAIWSALSAKPRDTLSRRRKLWITGGSLIILLCGLIPVPVVTLAPAEIVADNPFIIAAPMDGVVENILVAPNSRVEAGIRLVKMADTEFKSDLDVAAREETVAQARLRKASLTSFIDTAAKRELAIARAETDLAQARTHYAKTRFEQTELTAPKAGLAIYSHAQDWTGRPVSTGETIIEIADPEQIILKIDSPLLAGEALQDGARVRVFMDADPLKPLEAKIERASYYAAPTPNGQMAYETYARLSSPYALPRIGARGVAKIYGDTAPLIFWLFRRPIAAVRQFIGF